MTLVAQQHLCHLQECIAASRLVGQQLYYVQLETKGVPVPEDGGTISDPELLMEVMEQRECIEETEDLAILQAMLQENKLLQQATTEVRSKCSVPKGKAFCAVGYVE